MKLICTFSKKICAAPAVGALGAYRVAVYRRGTRRAWRKAATRERHGHLVMLSVLHCGGLVLVRSYSHIVRDWRWRVRRFPGAHWRETARWSHFWLLAVV